MKFEILNRWSHEVQVTAEIECAEDAAVSVKLGLAIRWAVENKASLSGASLGGANLRGADLRGASLSGADLSDANLRGASLSGASLSGADLSDANLRGASLSGADLGGASLSGADLSDASLGGANLRGASLGDARSIRLPTGETFEEYLRDVVPALLAAGGKTIESHREHWKCHDWTNCPMAHAFDIKDEKDAPILLRPRVKQFVQLFDAGQIPVTVLDPTC